MLHMLAAPSLSVRIRHLMIAIDNIRVLIVKF